MIRGIAGQSWVDLAAMVDIEEFFKLKWKIFAGISRCDSVIGGYFPNRGEMFDVENSLRLSQMAGQIPDPLYTTHLKVIHAEHGIECLNEYNKLDEIERRQYLKLMGGYQPYRSILLKRPETPHSWTDNIVNFPELKKWIEALPLLAIHRVVIYLVDPFAPLILHKDWLRSESHSSEFFLMKVTDEKKFFIYDDEDRIKYPVTSPAVFFNEADWHGGEPLYKQAISIKINGIFNPAVRTRCGYTCPEF